MAIFISIHGSTEIRVSGDTFPINKLLGMQGLKFKFNKDKKQWKGALSLKALELLSEQSGAILTIAARDEMAAMQKSAEKKKAYMKARAYISKFLSTEVKPEAI